MVTNRFRRVAALGFREGELPADVVARLEDLADEVTVVEPGSQPLECEITDGLLVPLGATVDAALIDALPSLRYVGILGTGFGGIDVRTCTEKGIAVCNVAGYSTDAVAELCLAMLLDRHRDLHRARAQAEAGSLDEKGFEGTELGSLRFGIVGAGAIGTRFAELVHRGLRADVTYWSRRRKPDLEAGGVRYLELDEIARVCDVVSVHLASSESTRGMLGAAFLDALPDGATVVATVPLDVFDVEALVDRVVRRRLSLVTDHSDGLAPEHLHTLMGCPDAIVYPSIGYVTVQASARKHRAFVDAVESFLAGERYNRVDPA